MLVLGVLELDLVFLGYYVGLVVGFWWFRFLRSLLLGLLFGFYVGTLSVVWVLFGVYVAWVGVLGLSLIMGVFYLMWKFAVLLFTSICC